MRRSHTHRVALHSEIPPTILKKAHIRKRFMEKNEDKNIKKLPKTTPGKCFESRIENKSSVNVGINKLS